MIRFGLLLSLALGIAPAHASGQSAPGISLVPVPEVAYSQVPDLPRGKGVLVEMIDNESAAFRGGLRRYDILVSFAGSPVKDASELQDKLKKIEPGQIVNLTLFRAGQQKVLPFTLPKSHETGLNAYTLPKGFVKSGNLPPVSVQAQPMDNGKLDVTILFYADNAGKLERLHLVGPINDIETQFHTQAREKQLPVRVVDLVDVSLRRLRVLNTTPTQK